MVGLGLLGLSPIKLGVLMTVHARLAMRITAVVALAASLSACATITRGTTEAWSVETTPGGAAVKTSSGFSCDQTPCTFKIPRKGAFDVTITKSGYKTVNTRVETQVAGGGGAGMAGNVLVGGLIGVGVDAASGAMLEHKPNPLKVTLEKQD